MATTKSQLRAGVKFNDLAANEAGLSSDQIASRAQSLTDYSSSIPKEDYQSFQKANPGLVFTKEELGYYNAAKPSGSITSEVLSGNPKPLTLPPPTVQTLTTGAQDYITSQNESIKTAQQQQLDAEKASLDNQKNDILGLIEGIGNSGQIKNDLYKKEGVDSARKT